MTKKLVYETVYDEIRRRIEERAWKPGDRIPTIEEIAGELQVGVSSVREAVRILHKQKILTVEQGRGTFVSDRIPENAHPYVEALERGSWRELTEARLVIEPELAAMAARKATPEEARRIVEAAERMRRKVERGEPFLKEDLAFHELVAQASQNEVLVQMVRGVAYRLLDSRRRTMRLPGMDEKAASYHHLIAMAIEGRNESQARELMRLHLLDMMNEL
ncbi:FCD domain-containing protein [Paenibacillus sp. TRM 82003]|nr:FCD domain-containing protein [Paenibacillus sp. TRM 82003]